MADKEDVDMQAKEGQQDINQLIDMLDDTDPPKEEQKGAVDLETIKATLDRYKMEAFKGKDTDLDNMVADLRIIIDRVDQGTLPADLDNVFQNFIRIWSERRFFKAEIHSQALINGFFQYWMSKRCKVDKLTKENLKALSQILSDDSAFYSLQYTSKCMEDMTSENEEVKLNNPIEYTLPDEFTETNRTVYSPFLKDNINCFCKINGFEELINLIQTHQLGVKAIREVLDICLAIKSYLKADFKFQIFEAVVFKIIDIFKGYTNETLKAITQDDMEKFVNCLEFLLEEIYTDKKQIDKAIQELELGLALLYIHTPYIEKRVQGINILISKVNLVNKSNFPCSWKRKAFQNNQDVWLTSDKYLEWLTKYNIFSLFFGETLHSEIVVKYYAVLSFLYSKDKLNEKHLELIWD